MMHIRVWLCFSLQVFSCYNTNDVRTFEDLERYNQQVRWFSWPHFLAILPPPPDSDVLAPLLLVLVETISEFGHKTLWLTSTILSFLSFISLFSFAFHSNFSIWCRYFPGRSGMHGSAAGPPAARTGAGSCGVVPGALLEWGQPETRPHHQGRTGTYCCVCLVLVVVSHSMFKIGG